MRVKDKIKMSFEELVQNGAINIVAFGDSVTHGALGLNEIDYETVYHNVLKKKINAVRSYVPVNVINSGIGGDCAREAVKRMQRDVFDHHPDLVIVCFGLNDVNGSIEEYASALETIFAECTQRVEEVIFMTPNMLNTYVSEKTPAPYLDYAGITAAYQTGGRMDEYMERARTVAEKAGVTVCDCYARWKQMQQNGIDTTSLLANGINHPKREMHELFAEELFKIIMDDCSVTAEAESTMYRG